MAGLKSPAAGQKLHGSLLFHPYPAKLWWVHRSCIMKYCLATSRGSRSSTTNNILWNCLRFDVFLYCICMSSCIVFLGNTYAFVTEVTILKENLIDWLILCFQWTVTIPTGPVDGILPPARISSSTSDASATPQRSTAMIIIKCLIQEKL